MAANNLEVSRAAIQQMRRDLATLLRQLGNEEVVAAKVTSTAILAAATTLDGNIQAVNSSTGKFAISLT